MLAVDVALATKRRLTTPPLLSGLIVVTFPEEYGTGTVQSFAWHTLNRPGGWVKVLRPRQIGSRPLTALWSVTVEANARTEGQARQLARLVSARLHGTPHDVTGFTQEGDTSFGAVSDGFKYVIPFTANLTRQFLLTP